MSDVLVLRIVRAVDPARTLDAVIDVVIERGTITRAAFALACACPAAISCSNLGAHPSHIAASPFQHTSGQTHFPQRVHCLK